MTTDKSVESTLRRFAGAGTLGELGGVQRFNPCDEEAPTRRSPQPAGSALRATGIPPTASHPGGSAGGVLEAAGRPFLEPGECPSGGPQW